MTNNQKIQAAKAVYVELIGRHDVAFIKTTKAQARFAAKHANGCGFRFDLQEDGSLYIGPEN